MEPRISIVTLAVDDLERAVRFYEAMGLERNSKITEGVAFFQMGGVILALWPREELAKDAGIDHEKPVAGADISRVGEKSYAGRVRSAFAGVALAYNTRSEAEVAEVISTAEKAGGRVLKQAGRAIWGGHQGYFEDTEGNLWEVAYNPDFPIDAEGRISLPD
ncbi:VOC family protein [Aquamicrobium sp. LC103]|uniref:VOC family protein n=1 Tax=Aquamicrobium sp. LC103 TaxID=1120658 RepID=UPI00063EC627|nr:VOC family protein [Aquamicrobium sp. LC103]TKT69080.1 VOC family protein [Aquamicrobium sp. LC103]